MTTAPTRTFGERLRGLVPQLMRFGVIGLVGLVVDVGGFLGLGARPVMISFGEMQILANSDRSEMRVFIGDTEDQLREEKLNILDFPPRLVAEQLTRMEAVSSGASRAGVPAFLCHELPHTCYSVIQNLMIWVHIPAPLLPTL